MCWKIFHYANFGFNLGEEFRLKQYMCVERIVLAYTFTKIETKISVVKYFLTLSSFHTTTMAHFLSKINTFTVLTIP